MKLSPVKQLSKIALPGRIHPTRRLRINTNERKEIFVANCVADIQHLRLYLQISFMQVPMKENPTDLFCGCSISWLKSSNWVIRPSWLINQG